MDVAPGSSVLAQRNSRECLQVGFWRRTPVIHEDEVDVRWSESSSGAKVVWKSGCRWLHHHALSRKLDIHSRYRVECPCDDRVRPGFRPQVVGATEQLREALEDRIRLSPSCGEASRETPDCAQVTLAEIVDVHEAGSVEGDKVAVLVGGVAVRGLCVDTAAIHDLRDEGWFDIGRPV